MSECSCDPACDCPTLVELLRRRAHQQPDRRAITFLLDGEAHEIGLSYGELDRRARTIGAWLQGLGAAGERVLLLYPPGLDYLTAFFGCLYAGATAVPVYPPRPNRPDPRLQAVAMSAQATFALGTRALLSGLEARLAYAEELRAIRWMDIDNIDSALADCWRDPVIDCDTLAFLQYTSGSTSTPKGVMLTHGNLLHNLSLMHRCFDTTPSDHAVIWLPPYHDMGLIGGILEPLFGGWPVTLMSPLDFLQRPLRWLRAISRVRGTISGGPNFAYDLCVRKITAEQRMALDLSCWRVAFNGAEPIRAETLERFAEAFERCGFRRDAFRPCYGLAEATLIVSGRVSTSAMTASPISRRRAAQRLSEASAGSTGRMPARVIVSCGQILGGQEVAIVDPDAARRCPAGESGEIWVSGPSTATGYWNRPEETMHTFQAYMSDTGEGPFLRTGDLGYVEDGELFVTGRLKDLIIIDGRNHYPEDIELTIEKIHPAIRSGCCAAFSVTHQGQECLAVVAEVDRCCGPQKHASQTETSMERENNRALDAEEIVKAIRKAVAEHHDLRLHAAILIRRGTIPKTSSGKVRRHACRAAFAAGALTLWEAAAEGLSQPSPDAAPDARGGLRQG
ncbi:MAG: fatty acyl-AMP ligase [Acidobacteria bacterium]|nr:fatty acyl-AMP ligase [Acidobacteriota bacterium]